MAHPTDKIDRITVVVPVYDAFDAVRECLASLATHVHAPHHTLLIDDGSRDRRVLPLLEAHAAEAPSRVRVLRNRRNRGYTATINRGCESAGEDDVVLLNSDTRVTAGWLARLHRAATSREGVATVTPVSNAAGAFSVPERNRVNRIPPELGLDGMARLVEQVSPALYPPVPTGNGYCMLVSRVAIEEVGLFDAISFPDGCGEENDFCMRAAQAGLVNLVDDTTYIYHRRSASLGWRKRLLLVAGEWKMRRLHPSYRSRVHRWLEDDPLDDLRERLRTHLDRLQPAATAGREAS